MLPLRHLVFWLLVSEYFTTLDLKRSTTTLAIGLALGGVLGGGAAMLLTEAINAADLLLVLPLLCAAMVGQVIWLDHALEPIGGGPSGAEDGPENAPGLLDSLLSLPVLIPSLRVNDHSTLPAVMGRAATKPDGYQSRA